MANNPGTSQFPNALDDFADPSVTTYEDDAGYGHHTLHAQVHDAVEKIETACGTTPGTALFSSVYKARAYQGTAQGIASDADVKINFDTESFDPGSNFDIATNDRYTAPIAGYYLIAGAVTFAANATGTRKIEIHHNGTEIAIAEIPNNGATLYSTPTVTDIVQMAATDYVELYVYQTSGGTLNTVGGKANIFMSVHLLST